MYKRQIFFILGLLLIIKGADWFTDASLSLAKKLNIPTIVIGATLVSVATTMPEFFTSLIATIRGHTQIAIGNVLGSCICNIGLILGLVWICSTYVPNHDRTVQVKSFLLIGMTLSVWILSFGFGYTTLAQPATTRLHNLIPQLQPSAYCHPSSYHRTYCIPRVLTPTHFIIFLPRARRPTHR